MKKLDTLSIDSKVEYKLEFSRFRNKPYIQLKISLDGIGGIYANLSKENLETLLKELTNEE